MSRESDIAALEAKIAELRSKQITIKGKFDKHRDNINVLIQDLIRKAGIWDEMNALEVNRAQAQEKAQAAINVAGAKIAEYENIVKFLRDREEEEPTNPKQANGNKPVPDSTTSVESEEVVDTPDAAAMIDTYHPPGSAGVSIPEEKPQQAPKKAAIPEIPDFESP